MLRPRAAWAAFLLVVAACGPGGGDGPARLTPAELSFAQEDYDGDLVETTGFVRRFGTEEGATRLHFVVEDEAANRIQLDGGSPGRFVGQAVTVTGRFRYADLTGRRLEVDTISPRPAG